MSDKSTEQVLGYGLLVSLLYMMIDSFNEKNEYWFGVSIFILCIFIYSVIKMFKKKV